MKRILFPALWVALCLAAAGTASAQNKTMVLRVDGLACPFCAYGLEKKITAMPDVLSYDADLQKGEVIVVLKDEAEVEQELLKRLVREAGFTLRSVRFLNAGGNGGGQQTKGERE